MVPRPIFVHGAGGSTATWQQQEPRFEGCYVVALPGHPSGSSFSSVGAYAEWTAHTIRDIPGPRVIVGHSMGGAIALQLALDHPELVNGVVIIASAGRLFVPDAAFELAQTDLAAESERLVRKGWQAAGDEMVAREVAAMVEVGSTTLVDDYTACRAFDVTERLGEIGVPALIIAGQDDALVPLKFAEELAQGLRQSISVVVPGAGHWVMREHPATVDLLVAGFLARLELSGE
jgi:pimeloyl-ACP methyl ester carboxylesterase